MFLMLSVQVEAPMDKSKLMIRLDYCSTEKDHLAIGSIDQPVDCFRDLVYASGGNAVANTETDPYINSFTCCK